MEQNIVPRSSTQYWSQFIWSVCHLQRCSQLELKTVEADSTIENWSYTWTGNWHLLWNKWETGHSKWAQAIACIVYQLFWFSFCFSIAYIGKMYFSHWEPQGVSATMWSVYLEGSIAGEYQIVGGHSGRRTEYLGSLMTSTGVTGCSDDCYSSTMGVTVIRLEIHQSIRENFGCT